MSLDAYENHVTREPMSRSHGEFLPRTVGREIMALASSTAQEPDSAHVVPHYRENGPIPTGDAKSVPVELHRQKL